MLVEGGDLLPAKTSIPQFPPQLSLLNYIVMYGHFARIFSRGLKEVSHAYI